MQIQGAVYGFAEPLAKHLPASDRLEGIAEVLDPWGSAIVGPDDRHDVEAAAHFEDVVSTHELKRDVSQPPLFLRGDRLGGNALPPCLHLDEDQRVAITRDQINFTLLGLKTAQQDAHALAFQVAGGDSLAALPQQPIQEGPQDRWSHSIYAEVFFDRLGLRAERAPGRPGATRLEERLRVLVIRIDALEL
jgi:hypothetical protein